MIFYMTSATVSDKTILQIDADSLLFFIVFILNRQTFRCDFCLSWKFKNPKKLAGGSRATAKGRSPWKLLHFSKLKGLICFQKCVSVYILSCFNHPIWYGFKFKENGWSYKYDRPLTQFVQTYINLCTQYKFLHYKP